MKKIILLMAVTLMATSCKKSKKENPIPSTTELTVEDLSRRVNIVISGTWDIHTVVVTLNGDTVSQYQYVDNGSISYHSMPSTKGDVFSIYVPKIFSSVSGFITMSTVNDEGKKTNIKEAETVLEYIVK